MGGVRENMESPETLRKIFKYDPDTGKLFWRDRDRNLSGKEAGGPDKHIGGYIRVRVNGRLQLAHRVIVAMTYGKWPIGEVDHINGNRSDNRIENLRVVTRAENFRNKSRYASNKSGVTGVHWHSAAGKWCAAISIANGKTKHIGLFDTVDDAAAARALEASRLGYHANHGRAKQ